MDYQKLIYDQLRELNRAFREFAEANKQSDRFLPVKELAARFGISASQIYKTFPLRRVNGKRGMTESEATAHFKELTKTNL